MRNAGNLPLQGQNCTPRLEASISLTTPAQIRAHQVDFRNTGVVMEQIVVEIPQTEAVLTKI